MLYAIVKALLSGAIVATVSEIAKRSPGFGALVASLPLVSVLGMIGLWHDTRDPERLAAHALLLGCALTVLLYSLMDSLMVSLGPRFGLRL